MINGMKPICSWGKPRLRKPNDLSKITGFEYDEARVWIQVCQAGFFPSDPVNSGSFSMAVMVFTFPSATLIPKF